MILRKMHFWTYLTKHVLTNSSLYSLPDTLIKIILYIKKKLLKKLHMLKNMATQFRLTKISLYRLTSGYILVNILKLFKHLHSNLLEKKIIKRKSFV